MDLKKFFDKLRKHLTIPIKAQPKIEINFDTYDSQLTVPLTKLWGKFESEFGEDFEEVDFSKWSGKMQKKAVLNLDGLKIRVEGMRYDDPDYVPPPQIRHNPQEGADRIIDEWLSHHGRTFDDASPRKLRVLLHRVEDALEIDSTTRVDIELVNALNRLALSNYEVKPKEESS